MKKLLAALLAAALTALLTGCPTTGAKGGSTIPWGQPATWEGGIPGMGSPEDRRN